MVWVGLVTTWSAVVIQSVVSAARVLVSAGVVGGSGAETKIMITVKPAEKATSDDRPSVL